MFKAFGDAKDRWKIDGATMKGYYLHSESGYLYIWHQAAGVLYEHLQSTGQCQAQKMQMRLSVEVERRCGPRRFRS